MSPFETFATKADQADLFADTAYSGNNARNELGQNKEKRSGIHEKRVSQAAQRITHDQWPAESV